jgi:hypothetical protein
VRRTEVEVEDLRPPPVKDPEVAAPAAAFQSESSGEPSEGE